MTMQEKLLKVQQSNAWNANSKLVEAMEFHLPEDLVEKIKQETKSVSKIVPCSFEQFCDKFPETQKEFSSCKVNQLERVMYIYYPDIEQEKQRTYTFLTADKIEQYLDKLLYGDIEEMAVRKLIVFPPSYSSS